MVNHADNPYSDFLPLLIPGVRRGIRSLTSKGRAINSAQSQLKNDLRDQGLKGRDLRQEFRAQKGDVANDAVLGLKADKDAQKLESKENKWEAKAQGKPRMGGFISNVFSPKPDTIPDVQEGGDQNIPAATSSNNTTYIIVAVLVVVLIAGGVWYAKSKNSY